MTPEQTGGLLAYFAAAFPSWEMDENTPMVWAEALVSTPVDRGREVARRLVKSSRFVPTIAEFLAESQHIAYNDSLALAAGFAAQVDPVRSKRVAAAMRAGMAEAISQVPDHRDHDRWGGSRCPACSTRSERKDIARDVMVAIREVLDAEDES